MEGLAEAHFQHLPPLDISFSILGHPIHLLLKFHFTPILFEETWFVMGVLILIAGICRLALNKYPGKLQLVFELFTGFIRDLSVSSLGAKTGNRYLPLFLTLFMFILISNYMCLIPPIFQFFWTIIAFGHKLIAPDAVQIVYHSIVDWKLIAPDCTWYSWLYHFPIAEEPTKFLSTDLALGLTVLGTVHINALRHKGFLHYLGYYMHPLPAKMPWTFFFFLNPFFYLNIVGQFANTMSHSCRLFGNIYGGAIIIVIVSGLTKFLVVPLALLTFFGLFVGLIQSFVFTILAISYIGAMEEE